MIGSSAHIKIFTRRHAQACAALVLIACAWIGLRYYARESEVYSRVFRIGFQDSFPFQRVMPDGKPGGLAFEVVNEAARRQRIKLQWIAMPPGSPETQFRQGELDLWPLIADFPSRKSWISITKPWQLIGTWLAVKDTSPIFSAEQMQGRTLWYQNKTPGSLIATESFPKSILVIQPDQESVMRGIKSGTADGGLVWTTPDKNIKVYQESTGEPLSLKFLYLGKGEKTYGLGASYQTPGAIRAATLLQQEIGKMALDGTVSSLFFKSFLDP